MSREYRNGLGRVRSVVSGVLSMVLAATVAHADVLERKDGAVLQGRIIAEQTDSVTFEIGGGGMSIRQRVARTQIRRLIRENPEGPGYCVLPILGEIGVDVTADGVRVAMDQARRSGSEYLILVIDSGGGSVEEMGKIIALLRETGNQKLVAHVRNAFSAAAVIATACPRIYMAPNSSIGGAVAFRVGPAGTPELIEEKFLSIIRAQMRAATRLGGHNELLMRGMMESDIELVVVPGKTGPEVREASGIAEGQPQAASKVLKRRGQILTLTAQEATECGLSSGTAADLEAMKTLLGFKAWHEADDGPRRTLVQRQKEARLDLADQEERRQQDLVRQQKEAARKQYIDRVAPDLALIDAGIDKATAKAAAATEALNKLRDLYAMELRAIGEEHSRLVREAALTRDPLYWQARADAIRNDRVASLNQRYQPQFVGFAAERDAAAVELQRLAERKQTLLEGIASIK